MDDSEFPIVRMRVLGTSTDADMRERFEFLERQLARGERAAFIFDTRAGMPIHSTHRRLWSEWLRRNDPAIRTYVAGTAVLVGSAAMRGVFSAIFWLWRPSVPVVYANSLEEAEAVARAQLAGG